MMTASGATTTLNALVGNIGLIILLIGTTLVTYCMLYQYPSTSSFDTHWLSHGFCVTNPETTWINSHALSFYADAVLAMIIAHLYTTAQTTPAKSDATTTTTPPLQAAMLRGAIMGVFGHGAGHLYLGLHPQGMDLRFRPNNDDILISCASTAVTVMAFAAIFQGTMPLSSSQRLFLTALIATAGFTVLDVEPNLNFVYAQAAIYVSNALHMLTLSAEDKSSAVYAIYPYFQLPVLAVGVMESTACTGFLQRFGGHMLFDSSIGIGTIIIELLARRMEDGRAELISSASVGAKSKMS